MGNLDSIYKDLTFPEAKAERPYCFINMVTTIDGKILSGARDEDVLDLGSKNDHVVMKRIESQADGVIVGGTTFRVGPKKWNPIPATRIVVSSKGDLPFESTYLQGGHGYIASSDASNFDVPPPILQIKAGAQSLDFRVLFHKLRTELGITRLLVLGGSELNAQLLALDLVDELFLTIAPKVKLGRDVPTYADGDPLPRESMHRYELVEHHAVGDELFIRYRRNQGGPQNLE